MKKSRFVTIVEKQSGDILVHSGLEGAVLNIEKNKIPEFNMLCNGNIPKNDFPLINLAWEKVIGAFKKAKILVDNEFDELRFLEYTYGQRRFHNRSDLEVSISPTMKCNLACPYCYNPGTRTSMPQKTKDELFTVSADNKVPVPMMKQKERFGYCDQDDLQILQLPYKGDALSMVVLLPKEIEIIYFLQGLLHHQFHQEV